MKSDPRIFEDLGRKASADAYAAIKRTADLLDDPTERLALIFGAVARLCGSMRKSVAGEPALAATFEHAMVVFAPAAADGSAGSTVEPSVQL